MSERAGVRVSGTERGPAVTILVDGRQVRAYEGEMLAAALLAAGIRELRRGPETAGPRGAFCLMGVCQECVVEVDGAPRQACLTRVRAGMTVWRGIRGSG